jgi:hypothetical protein
MAAFNAMEEVEAGNCDWSVIAKCMPTLQLPIKCNVNGCTTLVHHVCQGLWEASPNGTKAPGCSTYCRAHHPFYEAHQDDPDSRTKTTVAATSSLFQSHAGLVIGTINKMIGKILGLFSSLYTKASMEATSMIEFQKNLDMSMWERKYLQDKELFGDGEVSIHDIIHDMCLNEKRVIMWHIGDDDLTNVCNFVPAMLIKVTESIFKVMDNNDDICFASLQLDGEEGMKALWGLYVKFPNDKFLEHCKVNSLFSDDANNRLDSIKHEVSTHNAATCQQAAKMMDRSARKIMRRVESKQALIAVGNVVHVPLVQQDRAKVDFHNLTAIIINVNNHFGVCQLW